MIRRIIGLFFMLAMVGIPYCSAQDSTRVVGAVMTIAGDELVIRDNSGKAIQITLVSNTFIRLLSPGPPLSMRPGTLHDIAVGDRVLVNMRKNGEAANAAFSVNIVSKAEPAKTDSTDPAPKPRTNAEEMNANQQDLESRAMARLGGTDRPAQSPASGNDLESRALQAMQTNSERAEQQRRQAEADAAASAAAMAQAQADAAAAAPAPPPRSNGVADFLNGLSAAMDSAAASMHQANQQRQEQIQQQQAQLAAMRDQQAQAALRRQQEEATAAAARAKQATTAHAATAIASNNGSIYRYTPAPANTSSPGVQSTGTSSPPTCVYLGPDLCVPNAKWQEILGAPTIYNTPDHTSTPDVTAPANYDVADGPNVHLCPKQGSVRVTYFLADDVGTSQDYPCHVGHQVIIRWKQKPQLAGDKGGSSDSGTSSVATGTSVAPDACVSGKWVQSPIYKTKQDLYLVSSCPTDVSVSWFLGSNIGKAGAIHALDTVQSSDGVYPGHDMSLSVYTCPMDHPRAVKANGDKVDGQRQPYHCVASTYVPSFMESAR